MTTGFEKAKEALARGEEIRLQRWVKAQYDQHGDEIPDTVEVAIFEARVLQPGEEVPLASREITLDEASELAGMPKVIDERRLASEREIQHFLDELRRNVVVEIDQHIGFSSADLRVARESSQRAAEANERGEYVASSKSLEIGVDRKQARYLIRRGAKYMRGESSAP